MKTIVSKCKRYLVYIGLISFVLDVLMLTPPLFMMSVFDKVRVPDLGSPDEN